MTFPASAIEATSPADRIWAYTNARGSRVWTPMKPVIAGAHEEQEYVLAEFHSALARQAEALKRENAEKDIRIAALEAGIGSVMHLLDGEAWDRARALLGGENAGN